MPLVEALSLGIPVIASNLNVLKETGGDIPEYIDPLDGCAWKEMILEYTADQSVKRHAQLQRMQNFKKPSWEDHFQIVDKIIEQCQQ